MKTNIVPCRKAIILFLTVLSFFLFNSLLLSQTAGLWKRRNPLPTGNNIWDIYFFDVNTGLLIGEAGTILKTSDGGQSWKSVNSPTSNDLRKLFFIDSNEGIIVGDEGTMLKTYDRGENFHSIISNTEKDLRSVFFIDEKTGWACGERGMIIHTTDKGEHWRTVHEGVFEEHTILNDVFFLDKSKGWTGGELWPEFSRKTILFTEDGGKTWDPVDCGRFYAILRIYFSNDNTGYVGGWSDFVVLNGNGDIINNKFMQDIYDIFFIDENNIWVTGVHKNREGFILKITGTDLSTEKSSIDTKGKLFCIYFIDKYNGWAAGEAGTIVHTTNGGKNWHCITSENHIDFNDVEFTSATHGYIVGDEVIYLFTTDGGNSWQYKDFDSPYVFSNITFFDDNNGWLTAYNYLRYEKTDYGRILKTTNGGLTWNETGNNLFKEIYDICFVTKEIGFIIEGNILKTIDGGETWKTINDEWASDLLFLNENKGWAYVENYIIYTNDGGETWNTPEGYLESNSDFKDIYVDCIFFRDENTGWAGISKGIITSADGGKNWVLQKYYHRSFIKDIHFISNNVGWAIGLDGLVLKTTDAGTHWTEDTRISKSSLKGIEFSSDSHGWIVGDHGTILEYNNEHMTKKNIPYKPEIFFHNFPNPFNDKTKFLFQLQNRHHLATVKIYNILGQEIKILKEEEGWESYTHFSDISWDGKDDTGNPVPSGIYLCKVEIKTIGTGERLSAIKKVTLLR